MLTKEQRRAAVKAAADRVMPGIAAVLVADAAIAKAKRIAVKCAYCGAKVGTSKSMLGGKLTDWHKPNRKAAPTIGKEGWCLGSGNVLPTKENPNAL